MFFVCLDSAKGNKIAILQDSSFLCITSTACNKTLAEGLAASMLCMSLPPHHCFQRAFLMLSFTWFSPAPPNSSSLSWLTFITPSWSQCCIPTHICFLILVIFPGPFFFFPLQDSKLYALVTSPAQDLSEVRNLVSSDFEYHLNFTVKQSPPLSK